MRNGSLRKLLVAAVALALCLAMMPAADMGLAFGEEQPADQPAGAEQSAVTEEGAAAGSSGGGEVADTASGVGEATAEPGSEQAGAGEGSAAGGAATGEGVEGAANGASGGTASGAAAEDTSKDDTAQDGMLSSGTGELSGSRTGAGAGILSTGSGNRNSDTEAEDAEKAQSKPAQPAPKTMPEVIIKTRTTIVIKAVSGIEYSIDGGTTVRRKAGTSGRITFQNLTPDTEYTIVNRRAATSEKAPSPWTEGTRVTTEKRPETEAEDRTRQGTKLNYSSIRATRGTSIRLELKNGSKGKLVKLSRKQKQILGVRSAGKNKWTLRLLAPGTVILKVKAGGRKYKCKVVVLPYRIGRHDSQFYAHRGIANRYPENSRVALQRAMKAGFYGTNFDLWPSKPDKRGHFEFIVSHDNKLKDMTSNKGTITDTVASRILKMKVTKGNNARRFNQRMMRMEDAIAITDRYNGYGQIEMKCNPGKPWTRKQTDELARRLSRLKHPERYQVESMDPYSLRNFRDSKKKYRNLEAVELNLVCGELTGNAEKLTQVCRKLGFQNMPAYYTKIDKGVVDNCRKNGIGIAAYAHINEDSNLVTRKLLKYDLDWLVMPSVPWFTGR